MTENKIIDWINDSLNKGFNKEQIKEALLKQNYNENQIEELFNQSNYNQTNNSENTNQKNNKEKKKRNKLLETLFIIILIAMLFGAMYFFSTGNEFLLDENITTQEIKLCYDFSEKIKTCSPYICEFYHPITGQILKKEIIGIENEKCLYKEEMPNNLELKLNLSKEATNSISKYFEENPTIRTQVVIRKDEINYVINGTNINNPIQDAINNEDCYLNLEEKNFNNSCNNNN